MDEVYNINWRNFINDNIPLDLRKVRNVSWVMVLFRPIMWLHLEFLTFRRRALYKVNHNSQICYLQAVVNDLFDPEIRGIRIKNAVIVPPLWLYEPEENKPIWLFEATEDGAVFLREESQIRGDGADFLVLLPQRLRPGDPTAREAFETSLKANINYYKLFVKNYNLKWEKEIN